jgi:phage-related protein
MISSMKALRFVGNSQAALASFPEEARRRAGFELWQVQLGLMPADFKPMPAVGAGVYEVRIKVGTQWHAFQKTTQKTALADIDLAARRYRLIGD